MRISLGAIQTLLEQSSKKVVLSADRGDYQDVMKGDPFDYELDVEEDIFTVSGLNSKREKLSDEKVAKLEKGIGSKFDSGTQPYKTLKKRMSDANLPPEKALKDPNSPQKLDKGTKLSLEYLKTSSVDGKKINGPMVALALSTMSEADLKKLVAVADDVNKYSSVVQGITGGMYTKYNEVINRPAVVVQTPSLKGPQFIKVNMVRINPGMNTYLSVGDNFLTSSNWFLRSSVGIIPPGNYSFSIWLQCNKGQTVVYDEFRVFLVELADKK